MRLGESTATNPVPEAQGESTQPGESEEESEDQNEGDKTPTKNRH
jgi:hypothetical protein